MNVFAHLSSKKAPACKILSASLAFFLSFLFVQLCILRVECQSVVLNDQSIVRPTTKRVGLNLGSINYWDNG
ncbi:hypothetical protein, partial [Acidicapsa ligni]|uniref:hypothetical protein n=1 Tax=Acidicapsa ligni TaxID=542300 RepID=UPI0021E07C41